MLKSKFIDILKTFTPEELKHFRDFVHSPFHNSNKNVIKLYDIIRKYNPQFESPSIDKEKLFRKIYPGKKYNDTVVRILLSDLLRLAEEFLIQIRSKREPFGEYLYLLEELKDRSLDSLYKTNFKYTSDILEKMDDTRTKYFSKFELEVINVDYYLRKDRQQEITGNVLERIENLIYFTLIELVRNIHDLIINERTYNAKFEFNIAYEFLNNFNFEAILEKLRINRTVHYSIILINYNLLMALMEEENEIRYDNLKQSIDEGFSQMSNIEKYHILHHLESCCLNRMKYNANKYRKEIFNVYNLMLPSNAYSYHTGEMTAQRFKNILVAAINLNELEWTEKFAEEYSGKVQQEYRESMFFFSRALISFCKKNYSDALENINKVRYDYFILKLDVKSWTLKIYYELKYFEQAFSMMDSYRHFLSKNKSLSPDVKERHLNFLKFAGELFKFGTEKRNGQISGFKNALNNTGNVVHKEWLFEKAEILAKA